MFARRRCRRGADPQPAYERPECWTRNAVHPRILRNSAAMSQCGNPPRQCANRITVIVLDRGLGARMIRLFLDDLQQRDEFTRPEFSRRSRRSRVAARAAHLLTRIV